MRLARVSSPRLRRLISEETKWALAAALEWTPEQIDRALDKYSPKHSRIALPDRAEFCRQLQHVARELEHIACDIMQSKNAQHRRVRR